MPLCDPIASLFHNIPYSLALSELIITQTRRQIRHFGPPITLILTQGQDQFFALGKE